jgi:hypothetical protein
VLFRNLRLKTSSRWPKIAGSIVPQVAAAFVMAAETAQEAQ